MSQAPDQQGPQVLPSEMPQVMAQQQAPLAAFGGGALREQQAAVGEQTSDHIGRAIQLETMKANQISMAERSAQINQIATKYMYGDDQNQGYMAQRGGNAVSAINPMLEKSDKEMQSVLESAPNDDVRRMVMKEYETSRDGMMRQSHAHLMEQREVYAKQTLDGVAQTSMEAGARAVGTPDATAQIQVNLQKGLQAIRSFGVAQSGDIMVGADGSVVEDADGHPKAGPETQSKMDAFADKYHTGIVASMMAQGRPGEAKAYLDANKDDLMKNPVGFKTLEKAVTTDYGKQKAQGTAMDLIAKYGKTEGPDGKPLTLSQVEGLVLSHTEKLPDAERIEVRRAISQHYGDAKQVLDHATQSQQAAVFDQIDKTGQVPDAYTIRGMDANQLRSYMQMRKDNKLSTDHATLYSLKDMANSSDPKERGDFANTNLWDYRTKLSDSDFKSLQSQQARLRNPKAHDEAVDKGYRVQTQVANETMIGLGMDPGNAKDPDVVAFRKALDERIGESKDPVTRDKAADIAKHLALKVVTDPYGTKKSLFQSGGSFSSVDPQDIPADDLKKVTASLNKRGIGKPTDTQIGIAYGAYLKMKYAH